MPRTVLILFTLLALLGCGKPAMSETEYANAFKAACEKYFAVSKEVAEADLPDRSGLTKDEALSALAAHIRTQNTKFKGLLTEFDLLVPPSEFQGIHAAYRSLLSGQIGRDNEIAAAIESHDRAKSDKLTEEFTPFLIGKLDNLISEIDKAGEGVPGLKEEILKLKSELTKI